MARQRFQAPKGTRDVLPGDAERQREAISLFGEIARRFGFGHLSTPIFEDIGVFLRIGDSTDVVTKEMYDFLDKDGRSLALRPELTASVVRSFIQHRPLEPWKVWYEGPQFRYERPQAGRYRQFTQVGVEALGTNDPVIDAEVIALASQFFAELGLRQVTLLLNSLGDPECRPAYLSALSSYLNERRDELSEQSQFTLEINPLRVLDSKRPQDSAVIEAAPVMVDFLSPDSAEHFSALRRALDQMSIPYQISPRLVRGLDYYTKTTFEFVGEAVSGSQNAVGGGGRYDGLAEALGGKNTPGVGLALGIDRTLLACDAEGVFNDQRTNVDVFIIDVTNEMVAPQLVAELAAAGIASNHAYDSRSMKAQFRAADRSGAPLGVIVGDDEYAASEVTLRPLTGDDRTQVRVPRSELTKQLLARLT